MYYLLEMLARFPYLLLIAQKQLILPHLVYRYTEVLASGSLLVAPIVPGVEEYFRPGVDFVSFQSELEYDGAVKDVQIPLLEDKDGKIWIGSTKGLSSFSLQKKEFTYYSFIDKNHMNLENVNVSAIFKDKKAN